MPTLAAQKEFASLVTVGCPYQLWTPYLCTYFVSEKKKTRNAVPYLRVGWGGTENSMQ